MNNEDLLLIQKSIEGELNEEEQVVFDEKLMQSEDFKKEFKLQKEILAHTEAHIKSNLKAEMLADFRSINQTESAKVIPLKRFYYYAAAASVVVIIGVFSILNLNSSSSSELYTAYYAPYDGIVNTRSDGALSSVGLSLYEQRNYEEALEIILQSHKIKDVTDGQRKLLIANCYLNLEQPGKSLEFLKQIAETESQLIKDNAKWYQVMSYLQLENKELAKDIIWNSLPIYVIWLVMFLLQVSSVYQVSGVLHAFYAALFLLLFLVCFIWIDAKSLINISKSSGQKNRY